MKKCLAHEITLIAWTADQHGNRSILDIVETSRRCAYFFVRGFYRNAEVTAISASAPGPITDIAIRNIDRADAPRLGLRERVKAEVFAAATADRGPERDARLAYWHERQRNMDRIYYRNGLYENRHPTKAERADARDLAKAGNWRDSAEARHESRQLGCDA